MIMNNVELDAVKRQIEEFHDRLRILFRRDDLSHFEVHLTASGYDKMIARLQREVEEYESRRSQACSEDETARA